MANLPELVDSHLAAARGAKNGRSAELILHDGVLRQTVIALRAGTELAEHNAPHAATVQVLRGAIQVTGAPSPVLAQGEIAVLTHERHAVTALEDAVFLLTTVTSVPPTGDPQRAR